MATVIDRRYNNRDEHSQTGILTSASSRLPAFPIRFGGTLGICSRYSGATVPDFHRVPRHLTAMTDEQRSSFSKNSLFLRRIKNLPREILRREFEWPLLLRHRSCGGRHPACRPARKIEPTSGPRFHIRPPGWKPGDTAARDGRRYGAVPGTGLEFQACAPSNTLT
jgi:hypothetical protein